MGMKKEFGEFIAKGNVVDLAVGVVIGAAFGKIVTKFVENIIMPFVSLVTPGGDWRNAGLTLSEGPVKVAPGMTPEQLAEAAKDDVILKFGDFLGAALDFIIVAFVLFLVVKSVNRMKARAEAPKA
jgi:large conductance mechanosensitive channel